jgi:hypothetical protein
MITHKLIAVPVDPAEIRSEFQRFLDQAKSNGWTELKVRFGFAWETPGERDSGLEEVLTPVELEERVDAAESDGKGRIGEDDLYLTPVANGVEHLFCHDADIHLTGPGNSVYLQSEATRYASLGWVVYESIKSGEETIFGKVHRFKPQDESC